MGSIFERPPARAALEDLEGHKLALDANAESQLRDVDVTPPVVLVLGSERGVLPDGVEGLRIPVHADSLNVAMAATVALYEVAHRMAADG
jgi:TrmH family RNA methyltransferase